MKNMIKKNKVLFIAIAIVLAGGSCLSAVLVSQAHTAMAAEQIVTAEAEAAETPAPKEPAAELTAQATAAPQPTAVNTTLSAEALSHLVRLKEMRRESIIPRLDNTVGSDNETWETAEQEGFSAKVLPAAAALAKAFFGYHMSEDNVIFQYYTDTSGHRSDLIKLITKDDSIVCTLAANTLELIEIDYYFLPASASASGDYDFREISDSDREIAKKVAAVFNTSISDIYTTDSGGSRHGIWTRTYALKMKNGELAQFSVMNGTLYAVGVFPSEAALQESVYFDADVQLDPSLIVPASTQDFRMGKPGKDDMTQDEAENIYQTFLTLAGGSGVYDKPNAAFYIDNSSARENCWHIEGKKLTMVIAARSKWIVSLICDNLWNPGLDLTKVIYSDMGGHEYASYVASIMTNIYGKDLREVSLNAKADDHFCTMDAWMADGSVYEFMFEDGKLHQVVYYADEECFRAHRRGWKADNKYINSATGETFVPT